MLCGPDKMCASVKAVSSTFFFNRPTPDTWKIRDACDGVDVPRSQGTAMQIWNENEINTFLRAAKDSQYYTLSYMALFTGMRRSELLALRWHLITLKILYKRPVIIGRVDVKENIPVGHADF